MENFRELHNLISSKSANELLEESGKLKKMLNTLPRYVLFFEETKIDDAIFTTDENKYEIISENITQYIIKEHGTQVTHILPKNLEETLYIEFASFDLSK